MEICPICRKETGTILMDRRLKDTFNRHTMNPGVVCDECKEKYLSVGVMLINPENGKLSVIKDEAFKRIFNKPIPSGKIAFADDEVLNMLQASA